MAQIEKSRATRVHNIAFFRIPTFLMKVVALECTIPTVQLPFQGAARFPSHGPAKSGAERFRMGVEMFEAARRMVLASLPAHLTETERKHRLFERLYGLPLPVRE